MLNLFVWCKELLAVHPDDASRTPPPSTPYTSCDWGLMVQLPLQQWANQDEALEHTFHTYLCCLERERKTKQKSDKIYLLFDILTKTLNIQKIL